MILASDTLLIWWLALPTAAAYLLTGALGPRVSVRQGQWLAWFPWGLHGLGLLFALFAPQQGGVRFGFAPAEPFAPTRWLADGDTVSVGQSTLTVRHCPGHTPGHVVFHSKTLNRAFVGDVLFAGSIGRTDFPRGDHDTLIDSITQRLWPMGNETVFIPGHGPESTFGRERQSNPYVGGT